MAAAVVEVDQRTLTPAAHGAWAADGKRPYEASVIAVQVEQRQFICWTYENGKMRHIAVEFGLADGWMCCSMCLAELPRLPKLLGWRDC